MSRFSHKSSAVALAALSVVALAAGSASADINGFIPANYTYQFNDTGNTPVVGNDSIELTTGRGQLRSLWFNARQDVSSPFTLSFTYRGLNLDSTNSQGLMAVLQNDPDGVNAVDPGFGPSTLGFVGTSPSIGAALYLDNNSSTSTGIFRDGNVGSGLTPTAPINAFDEQPIDVRLVYDGSLLTLTMTENGMTYAPQPFLVGSIASSLGSPTAYVGFTIASGGGSDNSDRQILSNFRFTSGVPEPTTAATLAGGAGLLALRRRRAGAAR